MKPVIGAIVLAFGASLLTSCSGSETKVTEPAAAAMKVEPLKFTQRTLANGLRVFALPDKNTANVAVHVWYDVGSKDDPVGRSGFAHLFEHIMFKATKNMPPENFDRLTEDVGGFNNASTWDDFTNYYEVVPANQLERVLWAEADRMGSLVVDEAAFKSERDVVKEEYRQRILASPYGKLFGLYVAQTNFTVHPYGRPGIGSIEDLDAATVDDVRAFHAAYYRPDNAVLVVAGNFDQATLDKWIDQYFNAVTSPKRPIPRVTAVEPKRTAPKEYTIYEPNVPLPAVTITYPGLAGRNPDYAVAMVLDAILANGESSRLYQSLVYKQQIAAQVQTGIEPTREPGAYTVAAIMSEGKSVEEGEKALLAEIAALRDKPVTQAELDEAKNELLSEAVQNRETAFGRGETIADSVIRYGDAAFADKQLASIQAVTAADIQRVAGVLFQDSQRVTIRYQSQDGKPKDAKADAIASATTIQAQKLDIPKSEIPVFALAAVDKRQKPPVAGAAVSASLPKTAETTLANGLRVIVASKRDLPIVSADLRILSGNSAEPVGRAGTADMAANVLTKGTSTRSATDIARQIESLGASLSTDADADGSSVSLVSLSGRINDAMAIASDVTRNPAFAQEELDRQRQQVLDGLSVSLKQPGALARLSMARLLFGDGPYGRVASPKSIGAISRADVVAFHASHWRPDNAVLVLAGDVSADQGFELAKKYFGDWTKPSTAMAAKPDATQATTGRRIVVVDLPKSGQAAVAFGTHGLARTDETFFPLLVANTVLGGGYSARLNQEIRIKRGLSYGASSSFSQRLAPAPIVAIAQTKNTTAVEVVDLMETELNRLGTTDISQDELTARSAALIGGFGRTVETASGLSAQLSQLASFNLPLTKLQSYVADVSAVTPAQVRAIAARIYDPKAANVVIAGDGEIFFSALKKKKPDAERIPADKLNLDSATLK
ncbi:MAG: pitrilysin family protein [Micropepsaceae bacterium]